MRSRNVRNTAVSRSNRITSNHRGTLPRFTKEGFTVSRLATVLFTLLVTAVPLITTSAVGCERVGYDTSAFGGTSTETVCWVGNASISVTGEVR